MSTQVPPSRLDSTKDFSSLVPSAFAKANAAFAQANAAFTQANTGGGGSSTDAYARDTANAGFITANSASSFANGSFLTANSASSFANGAFDRANAAYNAANTATDSWVRTQANNAYDAANSAADFANGAFVTANASYSSQNTTASFANGAFTKANSANELAQSSFDAANSSASFANGAFTTANLKFNSSGGTISGDVSITGNLAILGNTFSVSATQIVANDTMFIMGTGNYTTDVLDIGLSSHYNDGTNAHTGLIRDAGTKEWHVFEGYTLEVGSNNNIDINHASFKTATLNANLKSTTISIKGIDVLPYVNNAYDAANSGSSFANGAFTAANTADGKAVSAGLFANGSFDRANAAYNAANTATDPWVRTQANNAYDTANSSGSFANGAFLTANSGASFANAAFDRANAAYAQANTGGGSSTDAYARDTANAAFITANAAFLQANSGGGITYTASNTAPSGPVVGDQWYLIEDEILFEYINDGTNSYWLDTTGPSTTVGYPSVLPAFQVACANTSDGTFTTSQPVPFDLKLFDTANSFNTSTYSYTVPETGIYNVNWSLYFTKSGGNNQYMQVGMQKNGAFVTSGSTVIGLITIEPNATSTTGVTQVGGQILVSCTVGDVLRIIPRANNLRIYLGHCYFSGHLIR